MGFILINIIYESKKKKILIIIKLYSSKLIYPKKKINPLETTLYYLIIFFPVFFFFRSFILNLILITISVLFLTLSIQFKYNFLAKKYNIFLLIFFFYVIFLNLFFDPNNISVIKSIFLLKFFFLFNSIIFVYSRVSKKFLEKNLIYLFIFIVIISLDLLKQYFTGFNFIGLKPYFCNSSILDCQRYSGFFGPELVLGGYFSTIIMSSFILFKILKKNNLLNFFPLFILVMVFLSGERSAFLLTLVFSIIYYSFIINFNLKKILGIFFSICISILLINFSIKDSTKSRYYGDIINLIDSDQPNFLEALKLTPWGLHYNASISMIAEEPIFGNGFKSFRKNCKKYDTENIKESTEYRVCSTHPHNFHLEILVDAGLIGYSAFMIFLFYLFKDLKKNNVSNKLILNIIIIIMLTFIFLPRPTGSIFSTFFGTIYWFFIGSLFGYRKLITNTKKILNHK